MYQILKKYVTIPSIRWYCYLIFQNLICVKCVGRLRMTRVERLRKTQSHLTRVLQLRKTRVARLHKTRVKCDTMSDFPLLTFGTNANVNMQING